MHDLEVSNDGNYCGLRMLRLENRWLRVLLLPQAGGKIWQITYKPLSADLLWNNPRILPARRPGGCYDDVWSGGWDELFPNDEEATIEGRLYPDHGELWNAPWEAETFQSGDQAGVQLHMLALVSGVRVQKTVTLSRNVQGISIRYELTNTGSNSVPFLLKLHPAFNVTPNHRIDFPPMHVVREPSFPGTLAEAPAEFPWPCARAGSRTIDLRQVTHADERQLYFFYGTRMQAGWCALTDTATSLACGLRFDPAIFRCCWLFASYGGWRDYNVAVLEPCTGYPLNFDLMQKAGRHMTLAPAQTLTTGVLFSVHEGVRSVAHMDAAGTMTEEVERLR